MNEENEKFIDEELVIIATTFDLVEAEMLRSQLEAEGFEVYLADENIVGVINLLANAVGGIKIKVPSSEADEAAKFVEDYRNAEIVYDEDFPKTSSENE
ncbi:hypothetical protein BH10ACI1_BH10ACI1_31210 [soil metagenome]